jgi:uncharacterized repeat protein (TIGR01451 family)
MRSRLPLVAWLLFLVVPIEGLAQQRIIVNPTFVKRFQRDGTAMTDYNAAVPNSSCSPAGSCIRYLGDAKCLPPTNTPVDNQGCMAGWISTDPYDGNIRSPAIQNGNIKEPTQIGIGPMVEGLNVPNGAAELNAENAGRLYQIVCLASGELIPFSYSLGDPSSTFSSSSQARFGVFVNNTTYPGTPASPSSVANSTIVSTQTMVPQTGTVTAPAAGGLYQIGFEAIQPSSGVVGNYIADVNITLKPLIDFSAPALQIIEGQNGFLLVRVNGTVPAGGVSVSLQPGAATASPSDYTLGTPVAFGTSVVGSASLSSNGAGGYLLFIPQGAYDGNALSDARNETATTPSGSVRIPIATAADSIIEDNETFSLTVESPGMHGSSPIAQWDLATAASCSPSPSETATVTIVDNDVDLRVTKLVDNPAPAAGSSVTYTVTFTNNTAQPTVAPVTAHDANATVADAVPAGLTFTSWSCAASGGASCPGGAVNGTTSGSGMISGTPFLPAGGSVTFTINALVGATQCGSVTNTATVNVAAGLEEGAPGNNSASAMIAPICPATLAVAVTDGSAIYTPGSTGTYTITVTNSGLAAAADLNVADSLPSGVTLTAAPGCTPAGTATCGAISGSAGGGAFTATGGSLATGAGNSLTYTLPVAFAPAMTADPLVNTASASASNAPAPVSGNDSDTRSPFTVGVSKSTAATVAQPGSTVTYTVTATNSGAVTVPSVTLADPIPAGLTSFSWTCMEAGGAACPQASGSGAIHETLAAFPAGGSVQYQIAATVSSAPPATVTNTATITPSAGGVCFGGSAPPCSASAALPAGAVVSIHKSTTTASVTPNGPVSFTVTVTNSGSVPAPNTNLSDPQPAGIASQSWTCAPSGGAVCPAASGTGALNETIATLPAGGALLYTIAAVATATPPTAVTNTATITPPSGGTCEDGCSATAAASAAPVIDAEAMSTSINGVAGQSVAMTFKVTNAGVASADGTRIDDPLPSGLSSFAWTCSATGGAVCPNASGTGPIAETIGTFPSGGSLTYVVTALVSTSPPPAITNTVTITPPSGGLCTGSCIVTMQIRIAITSIPTLGTLGLLLLAAGLAVAATLLLRRR